MRYRKLASSRERLEALETETRRLQSEADSAVHREQQLNFTLSELRTELAVERRAKQAAEEQQKPMEARLSELREVSIRRETEIESFNQRIEGAIAENARLAEECETHRAEVEDLAGLDALLADNPFDRGFHRGVFEAEFGLLHRRAHLSDPRVRGAGARPQKGTRLPAHRRTASSPGRPPPTTHRPPTTT